MLNIVSSIVLTYKSISLFWFYLFGSPESQSASILYSGGKTELVVTVAENKAVVWSKYVLSPHGAWIIEAMKWPAAVLND